MSKAEKQGDTPMSEQQRPQTQSQTPCPACEEAEIFADAQCPECHSELLRLFSIVQHGGEE